MPPEYTSVEQIRIYRTTGDQAQWWLKRTPVYNLDPAKRAGTPRQFSIWGLNVSGDNSPAFWLDPIPDANGSSDLECYGRQLPKTMVSGGQGPEVRQRWQNACVDGALIDLYLRLAPGDSIMLALADRMSARWSGAKKEAEGQMMEDLYKAVEATDTMGYTGPSRNY